MFAGLAVLQFSAPAARAQATASPTPKELWEAYPLAPKDAPPTATPSEAATEGSAAPAPRRAAPAKQDDGGGGGVPLIPIGVAVLVAFAAGIALGRRARRRRREELEPVALAVTPLAPKRFQWRDYPEPARPAPPAPGASTFKAALAEQRSSSATRAKQEEPH